MRTTFDIAPDVLQAAKEIAAKGKSTAGAVISRVAKPDLTGRRLANDASGETTMRNGVPVIRGTGRVITLDHVRKLMGEEGI